MITVIRTTITTVLLSVLLCTAGNAEARLKYYRYNAEIPMVETTLNMMVAMGVLEQIPGHLVHDGNPYNRLINTQYGGYYARAPYALPVNTGYYNAPGYDRYQGLGPGPYSGSYYSGPYSGSYYSGAYASPYGHGGGYRDWNYPWGASRWAGDPWSAPQLSSPWNTTWGDLWNNPQWTYPQSQWSSPYTSWGDPWNSAYGGQLNSPWSSLWGSRLNSPYYVPYNSPWTSSLNYPWGGAANSMWSSPLSNTLVNPFANPLPGAGYSMPTPGYPGSVVQPGITPGITPGNTALFNYGNPGSVTPPGTTPGYGPGNTPLYNYGNPGNVVPPAGTPGYSPGNTSFNNYGNSGTSTFGDDRRSRGAPAGFDASRVNNAFSINNISLKRTADTERRTSSTRPNSADGGFKRRLDGLWIGDNGEMLGIRGNNFLWYDGEARYANGSLRLTPGELKITRAGTRRELSMRYRVVGNALYTVGRSGKMRRFHRKPLMQESHLVSELYASPSNYQVGSASTLESKSAPGSRAGVMTPYADGMSDLETGSVADFLGRNPAGTVAKTNRGDNSPLWSPPVQSAPGYDRTRTRQMAAVSVHPGRANAVADDGLSGARSDRSDSIIQNDGIAGFVDDKTAQSMKTFRRLQRGASPQPQFRHFQQRASVADRDARRRGVVLRSPAPSPIRQSTTRTPPQSSAVPVRTKTQRGTDTSKWSSTIPDQSANIWRQNGEETFELPDPSPYLYSYLKDKRFTSASAAVPAKKKGNIWAPTASSTGNTLAVSTRPSEQGTTSNIWKPSPTYNRQRRNGEVLNIYYADAADLLDEGALANANVTRFAWAE